MLVFQYKTPAKFRGYNQPTAKAVPVQIKTQISFFQYIIIWESQVSCFSGIEHKFLYTLTMYNRFSLCQWLWPGECKRSHFSFCIPLRFDMTDLHLQILCEFCAQDWKAVICPSSAWINPNYVVLSESAHFSYDNAYLRLIIFEQLSCSNYRHLGFKPQSWNKFWKRLQEPFYAHVGEPKIGGLLHSSKCKYLTSDSDCTVDLGRVGKTGVNKLKRTI